MIKEYGGYLVGLLWFISVAAVLFIVGTQIGKANYDANQQTHNQRMECIDRGGEIRYVTNIGTVCEKDD